MIGRIKQQIRSALGERVEGDLLNARFQSALIRATNNFRGLTWLGQPIWQSPLDLWNLQEAIARIRPELIIECGTNQGGSSLFFAHLMDLLGCGEIVTIDVERLHDIQHPRVTYVLGSSVDPHVSNPICERARACKGPVFVMLDSDHSSDHVFRELQTYAPLVTPGSYCMVQDGVIDLQPMYAEARPGPLDAIKRFLATTDRFEVDEQMCSRFLVTHHPMGWLKRVLS